MRRVSVGVVSRDLIAGLIVFLVALPLCLGIALASGAPLFSGLIAGIVGGILVGVLSGSSTSVSGPAAGLTAIVAAQIATLGSFEAFLVAVVLAGVLQIALGVARAGALSAFFPSSVIKGLLAAIGVILILKQIPHLVGYDADPEGEMSFEQPDRENTFSELVSLFLPGHVHQGAVVVGLLSVLVLLVWDRVPRLKKSLVPAPLVVVLLGVLIAYGLERLGGAWVIGPEHRVRVPEAASVSEFLGFLRTPDFTALGNPAVYVAAVTLAVVASLETLLNLEAVDKLDTLKRHSPPSRELLAQGCGNIVAGFLGGLPMTSVIIRGSVNVLAGARTKISAVFHGVLLLVCVGLLPALLNLIPLSSLAAILLLTGFKLASVKLFRQMWSEGRYQFLPFIVTLLAIVLTDLLIGILIGLGVGLLFILWSNLRRPVRRFVEKHAGGEVLHIELANQVSFLNRAALEKVLEDAPHGGHVLLDARRTDYIDPDVLSLIREYTSSTAPVRQIRVSLSGFKDDYRVDDEIQVVDFSTRELKEKLTPRQVLQILEEGNQRFQARRTLDRDLRRQLAEETVTQQPMAVVLGGINSRAPAELIFDLGLGDIFSVRIAGNVIANGVLGSLEYGCSAGGAKLIVVMSHTGSAMVATAIRLLASEEDTVNFTGCEHLRPILGQIQECVDPSELGRLRTQGAEASEAFLHEITRRNVLRSVQRILEESGTIRRLVEKRQIAIVGAMFDVASGRVEFLVDDAVGL